MPAITQKNLDNYMGQLSLINLNLLFWHAASQVILATARSKA